MILKDHKIYSTDLTDCKIKFTDHKTLLLPFLVFWDLFCDPWNLFYDLWKFILCSIHRTKVNFMYHIKNEQNTKQIWLQNKFQGSQNKFHLSQN